MNAITPAARPEVWGGFECSVVRVGDAFRDQFRDTGHAVRLPDLEAARALGISTLRYPVSWERVTPRLGDRPCWRWHDERLGELRRLGIRPVVGLVHHGGGPMGTGLLDPLFPERLAAYAGEVARRYPWVDAWTPVNEPLTTARFSGLYGHWWPHARSEEDFLRMVALQCRGVLLAMRAIRRERGADAVLVQTEDLGKTFSTAPLRYQADHENTRRWLSLDLLAGAVGEGHPFHARLLAAGVPRAHLEDFRAGDAAEPWIIGVNHYVTSERFLDHRLALYPPHLHGGNGRHAYADTEAARVPLPRGAPRTGWLPRLREVRARYPGAPIAVTEAHLGCSPDEQIRWLCEAWEAARALRAEGADLRALTVWSLLGAVDWCSLLTQRRGRYEPGAFDVSGAGGAPRATPLGEAVREIAATGGCSHPALEQPGWWRRPDRLHPALVAAASARDRAA